MLIHDPMIPATGNSAALLFAMSAELRLTSDDVAALEQAIAEGRRPQSQAPSFDEAPTVKE
jgi:hypothetical protein